MTSTLRFPAEWEPAEAVLIAWPHADTDWAYMLDDIRTTYGHIICAISQYAKVLVIGPEEPQKQFLPEDTVLENIIYHRMPTNDTWTRDYGPITVDIDGTKAVVDYQFNGWGLKFASDRDNLATLGLCEARIIKAPRINRLSFTLEGGSVESDGQGLLITTTECLMSPNRNGGLSRADIEDALRTDLGVDNILWIDHGALAGDDTDGHIDTLVRLVPPCDTLLYVGCSDPSDEHYECLSAMRADLEALRRPNGMPFNLIELPMPDAIYDPDEGIRLPATYANFLILNDVVLAPVYNQPLKDRHALMALQAAMPDHKIIPVDCRALIRQHGSLHCATMQLPEGVL